MEKNFDALSLDEITDKKQIALCSVLSDATQLTEDYFESNVLALRTFLVQSEVPVTSDVTIPDTDTDNYKWADGDEYKEIRDNNLLISNVFYKGKWVSSY